MYQPTSVCVFKLLQPQISINIRDLTCFDIIIGIIVLDWCQSIDIINGTGLEICTLGLFR